MKNIALTGRCTLEVANEIRTRLLEALENGLDRLTVDLAGLTEIDTAGIQLFVSGLKEAEARGIQIELRGPLDPDVASSFDISGVHYGA